MSAMSQPLNKSIAIVGGGLSGAVCAKALTGLVKNVSVFEKEETVGGKLLLTESLSTTPFFTVSTPFFQQLVDRWLEEGLVKQRSAWDVEISGSEMLSLNATQSEYVTEPQTASLVTALLSGLNVHTCTEVFDIESSGQQWRLFDVDGAYLGQFDCVIFTFAKPSSALMKKSELLTSATQLIDYSSVWTVILSFDDMVEMPFDRATIDHTDLASCFVQKPNEIILMATPEWSEKYSALPADQVATLLSNSFINLEQIDMVHRFTAKAIFWPNYSPINTLGQDCLFDQNLGLGACGEWCTSPRVEGAVLSGFSMADRVMKYLD